MEYIDGKTLLQMLKDSGGRPLPVAQVLDYAIQLCDVLIYLHSHHPPIIFRDLKPTNVMVKGNGHVVLIDFGIARLFKEGQAQDTVFWFRATRLQNNMVPHRRILVPISTPLELLFIVV
jgi:serine/threonine protein kinase